MAVHPNISPKQAIDLTIKRPKWGTNTPVITNRYNSDMENLGLIEEEFYDGVAHLNDIYKQNFPNKNNRRMNILMVTVEGEYAGWLHFQLRGMNFTPNKRQSRTDYVRGSNAATSLTAVNHSYCCDK
eukprot:9659202-Ditylum_brightwellii.AAC.1